MSEYLKTEPIRVLVVDDHPVMRTGIAGLLDGEPDFEIVGTAASGEEAIVLAAKCSPAVVLMDLRMPGMGGVEATRQILAGVRAVAAGQAVLAPSIAAQLVARVANTGGVSPTAPIPRLTPREAEILALVADGLSNPGIAERLVIGESTVKTHLLHVFEKLDVSDRTRAVTRAMELGIFPAR